MASVFQPHLDRVRAAVDATFGVEVDVEPLRSGETYGTAAPAVDLYRPPFRITGVIRFGSGGQQNFTAANTNQWSGRMESASAMLHVDPTRWPLAATIVPGDRLTLPDQSLTFTVSRIDRLSITRLVFNLAQDPA